MVFNLTCHSFHLLVFVAKHHPGDANTDAEGRQQQHADLWPFVQVWQVVLWDPAITKGTRVNKYNNYKDKYLQRAVKTRQFEYDRRRSRDINSPAAVCGGYSHHNGYSVPLIYTDVNKHIHASFVAWPLTRPDLSRAW